MPLSPSSLVLLPLPMSCSESAKCLLCTWSQARATATPTPRRTCRCQGTSCLIVPRRTSIIPRSSVQTSMATDWQQGLKCLPPTSPRWRRLSLVLDSAVQYSTVQYSTVRSKAGKRIGRGYHASADACMISLAGVAFEWQGAADAGPRGAGDLLQWGLLPDSVHLQPRQETGARTLLLGWPAEHSSKCSAPREVH